MNITELKEIAACSVMVLIDEYAKAVHDGDDAACVVLRRTIEASITQLEDTQGEIRALRATEAGLRERVKELEEGLRFYADPGDYKAPFTGGLGKLYFDCGLAARALLEKKE